MSKKLKDGFIKYGVKIIAHNINTAIKSRDVRLVGDNVTVGVYNATEALLMAREMGLDLVEISSGEIPICRIIEYSKFLYELKMKNKDRNKNKVIVKDIRFGAQCDEHDFTFKKNNAIKFLKEGNKVKAYVQFKGREIVHKQQGEMLLLRFANDLIDYGKAESLPALDGKKMQIIIAPKKK